MKDKNRGYFFRYANAMFSILIDKVSKNGKI